MWLVFDLNRIYRKLYSQKCNSPLDLWIDMHAWRLRWIQTSQSAALVRTRGIPNDAISINCQSLPYGSVSSVNVVKLVHPSESLTMELLHALTIALWSLHLNGSYFHTKGTLSKFPFKIMGISLPTQFWIKIVNKWLLQWQYILWFKNECMYFMHFYFFSELGKLPSFLAWEEEE